MLKHCIEDREKKPVICIKIHIIKIVFLIDIIGIVFLRCYYEMKYIGGCDMKAVQIVEYGGPEVLKVRDIEEPSPNKNEVKIKMYAIGLNPSESYTITGNYAYNIPDLPYTPGYDGSGLVEEVGENVTDFKIGDRVFVSAFDAKRNTGTYAEKLVVDAKNVYPLPDNVSLNEGAALGIPAFTAYRALIQKAHIKAGETVLIHGASGAVGSIAVQIAKSVGAVVIGTSSTEKGRATILELGADYAIPHVTPGNMDDIKGLTNKKGPDVIIEFLADVNLETDSLIIADYGRIVIVGSRGTIEFSPRNLMTNDATITGMAFIFQEPDDMNEMYHGVTALIRSGSLKPLIGKKFALEDIQEAHKHLMESSGDGRTLIELITE